MILLDGRASESMSKYIVRFTQMCESIHMLLPRHLYLYRFFKSEMNAFQYVKIIQKL